MQQEKICTCSGCISSGKVVEGEVVVKKKLKTISPKLTTVEICAENWLKGEKWVESVNGVAHFASNLMLARRPPC